MQAARGNSGLPRFSVFREHRLVVVVGEWIVEPDSDRRSTDEVRAARGHIRLRRVDRPRSTARVLHVATILFEML